MWLSPVNIFCLFMESDNSSAKSWLLVVCEYEKNYSLWISVPSSVKGGWYQDLPPGTSVRIKWDNVHACLHLSFKQSACGLWIGMVIQDSIQVNGKWSTHVTPKSFTKIFSFLCKVCDYREAASLGRCSEIQLTHLWSVGHTIECK